MGRAREEREEGEGSEERGRTTCIPHYFRPWNTLHEYNKINL